MTIVVTGGGSGGHITPLLAVAAEIKALEPTAKVIYVGERGGHLSDVPAGNINIDGAYSVSAGKLRRYHGDGLKQLTDIKTILLNLRDVVLTLAGLWQSYWLLGRLRPDVIFVKGGFVGVPVGLAAALRRIKYVTHDSDSTPGLANRIIARWARLHAVALEPSMYPYPEAKTVSVGVPVNGNYRPVTKKLKQQYRKELGFVNFEQIVLITGGGNGSRQLNQLTVENSKDLLTRYPKLALIHLAGRKLAAATKEVYDKTLTADLRERVIVKDFVNDLYRFSGAADIVIARGGATNLAEFAMQRKACLIVPSPQLIWNVRNSEALAKVGAIVELTEAQAEQEGRLAATISELLDNPERRSALGERLGEFARADSAEKLAQILLTTARKG